jgi:hypothetical protein
MAALFAYLLSITIFLGASYAGLVWLTEPPTRTSTPHAASVQTGGASRTKPPVSEQHAKVEKPPANLQETAGNPGPVESTGPARGDAPTVGKVGNDNAGVAAARKPELKPADLKPADTKQADAKPVDTPSPPSPPASKEQSQGGNSPRLDAKGDSVPPGGCMPIGMTAQGDLVFPMQCRDLLQQSAQAAAAPSPTRQPERTKSVGQASEPAVAPSQPTKPPPGDDNNSRGNSAVANRAEPPSTRTTNSDSQTEGNSPARTSVAREGLRRKKVVTRKPDQSPPPKATTDGHWDERPSPPSPSGNMASRSDDWFNPLGFR